MDLNEVVKYLPVLYPPLHMNRTSCTQVKNSMREKLVELLMKFTDVIEIKADGTVRQTARARARFAALDGDFRTNGVFGRRAKMKIDGSTNCCGVKWEHEDSTDDESSGTWLAGTTGKKRKRRESPSKLGRRRRRRRRRRRHRPSLSKVKASVEENRVRGFQGKALPRGKPRTDTSNQVGSATV